MLSLDHVSYVYCQRNSLKKYIRKSAMQSIVAQKSILELDKNYL